MQKENICDIIGFNPLDLPKNKCNEEHSMYFQIRALFKVMLYVHCQLNFERMFDPDLNHHIRQYSPHTKQEEDYFPIDYDPEIYTKTRMANCSIYSDYFERLARELGFEARHVGLKDPDGRRGHWCSEVKVNKQWIFFDPMYLVCPMIRQNKIGVFHPAYNIMKDPIDLYYNQIPSLLSGISKETVRGLWLGLEIDKVTSYEIGLPQFIKRFYGEDNE